MANNPSLDPKLLEITVTVGDDHPVIPAFRNIVARIKALTGRNAQPVASGFQSPPYKIVFRGTEEDYQTVCADGLNATIQR